MRYLLQATVLLALLVTVAGTPPLDAGQSPLATLTAMEREWLDRHPDKLILYYNTEFPPIEFASPTGEFVGLGADVIAAVEKRLGVVFHKQPCTDWNAHLAALASGQCAIAPTIVHTDERERFAFFTTAYATVPVVIITGRTAVEIDSLDDLEGRRVAVVSGYATEKYLIDRSGGRFQVLPVKNVVEGLRQVSFGQVDAFVENLAVAAYYIDREGLPNLRVAASTDYVFAWSIGVSRQYPLLASALQKALDDISAPERDEMRRQWISLEAPRAMNPQTLRLLKLVTLFTALLIASLTAITLLLKRRLNQKVVSLRDSEELHRGLISAIPDLVLRTTLDGTIVFVNDTDFPLLRQLGREATIGRNMFEFLAPEEHQRAMELTGKMLEAYQGIQEYRLVGPQGESLRCEVNGDVLRSADGTPFGMVYVVRDISARKQFEAERQKLQEQLLQAQKMESVGRLAGGVAHDFNNMLGAIIGNAELALRQIDDADPLHRYLTQILHAAERSATLTRQLLAFARKQTITPKVLDLNATVEGMLKMLRRLLGEDIDLQWRPGPGLWPVRMDPSQVDQILVNLCINAKDAITGNGWIAIETADTVVDQAQAEAIGDVAPDDYVLLTVRDNGCGMDAPTLARIFDPFFTTKEVGKGTGLGLATVYGIVKQNDGAITVSSEPGNGTVFHIYIPRHTGLAEQNGETLFREIPRGHGETILIVEDEPSILQMAATMLGFLGYTVLSAGSPAQALGLADADIVGVNLLITDVIMPEMNGKELADRLQERFPELKCLFMSGYTAEAIAHHGVLDHGVLFLQKPFSLMDLAVKVRTALA